MIHFNKVEDFDNIFVLTEILTLSPRLTACKTRFREMALDFPVPEDPHTARFALRRVSFGSVRT